MCREQSTAAAAQAQRRSEVAELERRQREVVEHHRLQPFVAVGIAHVERIAEQRPARW